MRKLRSNFRESKNTQVLFADMYLNYGMNSFQVQKQFIEHSHRVLDDTGWLVINYHELPRFDSDFIQCLQSYFAEVLICPTVCGNYILFSSKSRVENLHLDGYVTSITELEKKLKIKLLRLFKKMNRYNGDC